MSSATMLGMGRIAKGGAKLLFGDEMATKLEVLQQKRAKLSAADKNNQCVVS